MQGTQIMHMTSYQ